MTPRTEEQYEAIRQQSRETILKAALELFALNGFHNTSVSKISERAGFSKGLIYNYFESKEQLLQTILEKAIQIGEKIMPEDFSQKEDRSLTKTIHEIFNLIKVNPHYWKLILALSLHEDIKHRFHHIIRPRQERNLNNLIELLKEKGVQQARLEALAISALLDGVLLQFIYMGDQYPIDEMEDFLIEKFKKFN